MVSWLLVIAEMPLAPPATSSISSPASSVIPNSPSTRMNDHRSSSNNPDNLSLQVAIHTKSHQLPFNSCWAVRLLHNLSLILITSPTTILNSPINWFCPLDTALVLTSDDFHWIFPPSPPLFPLSCLAPTLVPLFQNCYLTPYLLFADQERDLWSLKHFN